MIHVKMVMVASRAVLRCVGLRSSGAICSSAVSAMSSEGRHAPGCSVSSMFCGVSGSGAGGVWWEAGRHAELVPVDPLAVLEGVVEGCLEDIEIRVCEARAEGVGVCMHGERWVVVCEKVEELAAIARAITSGEGDVSVDGTRGATVGAVVKTAKDKRFEPIGSTYAARCDNVVVL